MDSRVFSVLVADDDVQCRESVKALLERDGLQTFAVDTGGQALEYVQEHPVHLLILDQYMPDLTGTQTLKRIMEIDRACPSIIMSGELTTKTKMEAMDAGAFTCISKPIQSAIMRHAVQQMIDRYYRKPRRRP